MEHNVIEELIPAYALGILDEEDALLVAAHLPECPTCLQQLKTYEETAALMLAASSPPRTAPAGLHTKLMANLAVSRSDSSQGSSWGERLQSVLHQGRLWQLGAAVSIVLLIGAVISLFVVPSQWKIGATVHMQGTNLAPDAIGLLQVTSPTSGTLKVTDLPLLDETKQYQLWLIKADGSRDSGAVFSVEENGSATVPVHLPLPIGRYSDLGITIEPEGGSPAPTGSKVLGS